MRLTKFHLVKKDINSGPLKMTSIRADFLTVADILTTICTLVMKR